MSSTEVHVPGFFSDMFSSDKISQNDGFDVDVLKFRVCQPLKNTFFHFHFISCPSFPFPHQDRDETALFSGRFQETRDKLSRSAHCIIEICGSVVLLAGTREERERAKFYIETLRKGGRSGKMQSFFFF